MKSAPSLVVETIIERIVKPLVEEANLDQVEPSPAWPTVCGFVFSDGSGP